MVVPRHSIGILIGFLFAAQLLSGAPLRCARSSFDPTLFRWRYDPEIYLFASSDVEQLTNLPSQARRSMESALGKVRTHGAIRTLQPERLQKALAEADSFSSSSYGIELANFLGNGGPFDVPVELRVEAPLLHALAPAQHPAAVKLAKALEPLFVNHNLPLMTFATDVSDDAVMAFRQQLETRGISCLIGKEIQGAVAGTPALLDYLVINPETLPFPYRDQAAMGYIRSVVGERPVILRVHKASFFPELFWLATGAAGVRYDFPADESDIRWRKGICTVMKFVGNRPIRYYSTGPHEALLGAFSVLGNRMYFALPERKDILRWTVPLPAEPVNVYRFWYDPSNDVFVQQAPLLNQHDFIRFETKTPRTSCPSLFGMAYLPSRDDRQTTLGPITALWGEVPE